MAAVLGGKDFRQLQLRAAGFTERAIYLPIQRFLTFALLSELTLVGEDSARGHVVRIVRTVNVANGRCSYRFGDVCGSILGRGNFEFGSDRARRILLGGKRVRIDE